MCAALTVVRILELSDVCELAHLRRLVSALCVLLGIGIIRRVQIVGTLNGTERLSVGLNDLAPSPIDLHFEHRRRSPVVPPPLGAYRWDGFLQKKTQNIQRDTKTT